MKVQPVGAVALYTLTSGDETFISACVVQVEGLTGSIMPQLRVAMEGTVDVTAPTYQNCAYTNLATGAAVGAGTPITADGVYEFATDGCVLAFNVTSLTGTCTLYIKPLVGAAAGSSSGSGGAVTIADGADVAEGATTDAAVGDANGTVNAHARMSAKAAAQGAADNSTNSTFKAPVIPATANAAAPSWTEGRQAPLSVDLSGNLRTSSTPATGAADNSTNSTAKTPVLVGTANAAAPSWTEGRQVPASTDLAGNLRVIPAATEAHLGQVGGTTAAVGVEITRPADTTAYAVGDSVNTSTSAPTLITFTNAARVASGTGYITKARLTTDQSACVAQMRLWLYNANTAFLNNDNAAFLIKYADKATRIGYIDFPALSTEAGSDCAFSFVPDSDPATPNFTALAFTADSGRSIYGAFETKTAFTPASGQKFYVELTFETN